MQRIDKVLRKLVLDEIEQVAYLAEDYGRLVGDAACSIDLPTLAVRLYQLRLCCIAMIKTHNELIDLMEASDGQGVAAREPAHDHREDQRSSDGVA
jgi:hypothetical protein